MITSCPQLSPTRTGLLAVLALASGLTLAACGEDPVPAVTDAPSGVVDAAAIDAATAIDAPMGSATQINCGTATCDRASQVCCFTGFPTITTMCTATAQCTNLPGRCDGPEDCASGEVCCGTQTGASCMAQAQCTGQTAARLCHTAADCSSGQVCRMSQFVAWPICAQS
jgi:hypothetical protein